uniref:Putative ferritin n=1 Tax=Ixodes ricinus TaxID=34613 RepID=V5HHQ9_IXORI
MAATQPRQNYHVDCEARITSRSNMEFYASLRLRPPWPATSTVDDVALPGSTSFFKKCSHEETEATPRSVEWRTRTSAEAALELEKTVNQSLLELHKLDHREGTTGQTCATSWRATT